LTDGWSTPARPGLHLLFRPARLYAALDGRPTFLGPVFLLVAAALLYTQVAFGKAFPLLASDLVSRSAVTETELARNFRLMLAVASVLVPLVLTFALSVAGWLLLLVLRARRPLALVTALVAWSAIWIALGLVAKTGLVVLTGAPDPPVNLGWVIRPEAAVARGLVALTNPFVLLAALWVVRGLAAWGVPGIRRAVAGAGPWLALAAAVAVLSGGSERLTAEGPVDTTGYREVDEGELTFLFPPRTPGEQARSIASTVTRAATETLAQLGERLAERSGDGELPDLEPRPVRFVVFPDHPTLERATGELLHVRTTVSIRGHDLVYAEMPGTSAAVPADRGLRELMRYALVMQLAPRLGDAPRWFVHGIAHARVYPGSESLNEEYLSVLRRLGVPSYEQMLDPATFRQPEGPVLARALVDHLAFFYGREALEDIVLDLLQGTGFRDALYARTRLTTSALESGWQDHAMALLSVDEMDPALADSVREAAREERRERDGQPDR
jgi:hypothetical protein